MTLSSGPICVFGSPQEFAVQIKSSPGGELVLLFVLALAFVAAAFSRFWRPGQGPTGKAGALAFGWQLCPQRPLCESRLS